MGYIMRKKRLPVTETLYAVYLIATVLSLVIAYMDLDHPFFFKFVLGYIFFTFFLLLYTPIVTIINLKLFEWQEIRRSIVRFVIYFVVLSFISYGFNYLFKRESINVLKIFSVNIGLSFGITFFDYLFLNLKTKN